MSILITGGNGFIASHLISKLINNYKVYLHTRSVTKESNFLYAHQPISLLGPLTINALGDYKIEDCDCVIHLAGSFSAKSFEELVFDNVVTTNTILDFMKLKKIPKIIFISSAAVWGKNLTSIATENTPAHPETDYAHTKFSAECLVKNAYLNGDIETAFILRPNTLYGYGSNSGVIDSFINQATKEFKFQIFGDGLQQRQPLYIDDLVDAIIKCLIIKSSALNIYGLAGPEHLTILDIVNRISKIYNLTLDCKFLPAQTNKPQTILINQLKINEELLWHPKVTLDHGLKSIFDLRNTPNLI